MVKIPYTIFLLTTVCIVVNSIRFTDHDGLRAHGARHRRGSESFEVTEDPPEEPTERNTAYAVTTDLTLETTGDSDDEDDEDYDYEDPIMIGPGSSATTAPTTTSTPDPTEPTTEYVPDAPRLPALCMLEPEEGVCGSGATGSEAFRYFFDHETEECELFFYSGCNGNENNFETPEQCKERCQDTPDGECALLPEKGLCRENFPRYHWDKELGDCKQFNYSGCAGNANNFGSQEECRKFCKAKSTYLKLWKKVWNAMQSWISRGYS